MEIDHQDVRGERVGGLDSSGLDGGHGDIL